MPSVQAAGMWEPDMRAADIAVADKAADMQAVWVVELVVRQAGVRAA